MAARLAQRGVLILLASLAFGGCTDGRVPKAPPVRFEQPQTPPPQTNAVEAAQVQFNGQTTEALNFVIKNGDLVAIGRPFGIMRLNVSSNAENPQFLSAGRDSIDTTFPFGKWVVDWYASGGIGMIGNFVFTSGVVGMSIFNYNDIRHPREVRRYPRENENPESENVIQDTAFVFKAIVPHPTQPIIYGIAEDFIYVYRIGNGLSATLLAKYSNSSLPLNARCCVQSATLWKNKIFVATRGALVWYDVFANGALDVGAVVDFLSAEAVTSTNNNLFVYHNPSNANPAGTAYPRGVYVFGPDGNSKALLNINDVIRMAATDNHVFVNSDNTMIRIYRINWTD